MSGDEVRRHVQFTRKAGVVAGGTGSTGRRRATGVRPIMWRRLAATAGVLASLALIAHAQPTVTIRGRVVADDTGDAIPNARVGLATISPGAPVVLTDADGRFVLQSPPGRAVVVASKTGYARKDATATTGADVEIRLVRGSAIAGRVVDEFGDPAPAVRVMVEAASASPGATVTVGSTDTDDRGEYRLGSLPAGNVVVAIVRLQATAMNPLRSMPQKTYFPSAATPADAQVLELEPGDLHPDLDFVVPADPLPLPPAVIMRQLAGIPEPKPTADATGVIRGRVTSTEGRALSRAQVRLILERDYLAAANTDADGRFEFRDLPAGVFRLQAGKAGYGGALFGAGTNQTLTLAVGETREGVDVALSRYGTLAGRVLDELGEPLQGANVQLLQVRYEGGRRRLVPAAGGLRLTDDQGRYRLFGLAAGQYIVSASIGGVASIDVPGYARAYFPGTPNPGQAQFVPVGLSQDVVGIDVSMSRTITRRVTGRALDAAGGTIGGSLTLMPSHASSSVTSVPVGARILPDGRFEFPNLTPGQYVIQAYRGRQNSSTEGEFGAIPVAVADADVTGLLLQAAAGSSISGHFTFESDDRSRRPAAGAIELSPIPVDFDLSPSNNWASAEVHDDWTFTMAGISGPRRLQLVSVPPPWALKEIRVNRVDVTDRPLPFGRKEQSLADVEVVLTDRVSELSGTVTGDRSAAAPPVIAIVFSTDRNAWYFASRFLRKANVGRDGSFTITGLPFGSYYAAAVAAPFAGDDWQDPAFLESLTAQASTLTLRDGQKTTLTLPLKF